MDGKVRTHLIVQHGSFHGVLEKRMFHSLVFRTELLEFLPKLQIFGTECGKKLAFFIESRARHGYPTSFLKRDAAG